MHLMIYHSIIASYTESG